MLTWCECLTHCDTESTTYYFVQLEGEAAWDSVMATTEAMKPLANSQVVFLATVKSV